MIINLSQSPNQIQHHIGKQISDALNSFNIPQHSTLSKFEILQSRLSQLEFKTPNKFKDLDPGFHPDNLKAGLLALPNSTAQISALLKICNELEIGIVTQGGLTGLSGAAATTSDNLILKTSRLNKIIEIDHVGGTATIESGVTLENLEQQANQFGLSCGIDLAARGSATLGGMVATNAGGIEAFRNGVMRNRVLGLEVVLADGRILSDLKRVSKANEGYDIKQLFIGAEGTLGVISKIVLSLAPKQPKSDTALISCNDALQATSLFRELHNHQEIQLLSAEVMWPEYARLVAESTHSQSVLAFEESNSALFVLIETAQSLQDEISPVEEFLMLAIEREKINNVVMAKNDKERAAMWKIREDSFVVDKHYPHGFWFDMSVPLHHMPEYSESLFADINAISDSIKVFLFAHLGDGNFHATISSGHPIPELEPEINQAVYQSLNHYGGSFSAEHGIGIDKHASLQKYRGKESLEIMKSIKQLLDPKAIMNPGKVI